MTVVGTKLLNDFGKKHATVRDVLAAWLKEAQAASWQTPQDIKNRFSTASFVGSDRVVFNIKGNHYRLDVQINFATKVVLVKRIGTHAEYDSWEF